MPRPRLHISARLEDALHRGLRAVAEQHGWIPTVTVSTGYGGPDVVRVFARVLLAPPPLSRAAHRSTTGPTTGHTTRRGWRSLLTLPAAGVAVTVSIGGTTSELTSGRGGYVHAEIPTTLSPGWHHATVAVEGREAVLSPVRVVDSQESYGVVSDIDDTIMVTWVPRPLLAAWNTLFLREHARRPVPGMSELLRALTGEHGFMVYLSTGAWNFAPHLERFMTEHGFPPGPMFLTDWGPTQEGWFRSGAAHKRHTLERLHREHPHTTWVLVGDDGQRDPEVYAAFAAEHPDAVAAVAIRQLTPTQKVLAVGAASATPAQDAAKVAAGAAKSPTEDAVAEPPPTVPWVTGSDGFELASRLEQIDLGGRAHVRPSSS